MILFVNKDQFIILPTVAIVRECDVMMFNISWLMFGMSIPLFIVHSK